MKPYLIGIAGGTASGKSELAKSIRARAQPAEVSVFTLDSYYRPQDHLGIEERQKLNFDHPDSLDFDLIYLEVTRLLHGQAIDLPLYDFTQHNRQGISHTLVPSPIVILEGILVFSDHRLIKSCDLRVFVDCPAEIRLARRIERDTRERGRSRESVLSQWQSTVHPMHEQYCAPAKELADLVVDGRSETQAVVDKILELARTRPQKI